MKHCFVLPAVSLVLLTFATATAQEASEEDVFELSPFSVEANWRSGYRASSTLAGNRIDTNLQQAQGSNVRFYEVGAVIDGVTGESDPTLLGSDRVRIHFGFGFYDDKESTRRQKLVELLAIAKDRVGEFPDFEFAPGSILISEGDRNRKFDKRRAEYTSYARFSITFPIQAGESPFETAMRARQLVAGLDIENDVTKLYFGPTELLQDNPFSGLPAYARAESTSPLRASVRGGNLSGVTDRLHRPIPQSAPQVPVTLLKSADAVAVHFAATIHADSPSTIDAEAKRFLTTARERLEADPALSLEVGAILAAPATLNPEPESLCQAQFVVSFKIAEEVRVAEKVNAIRETVGALEAEGAVSEIHYGQANLIVENANRYRSELLQAIQADLQRFDESIGEAFTVEPRIENAAVRLSQYSDSEVEIWIPYRFDIVSTRDRAMEEQRLLRDHEKAMALANASAKTRCCQRCDADERN